MRYFYVVGALIILVLLKRFLMWGSVMEEFDKVDIDWNNVKVPLILHQTAGPHASALAMEFVNECRDMHVGWKHILWTDEQIVEFVRVYYPHIYPRFVEMEPFIRQVDTVRYLWLHKMGGVYLDIDGECLRPATRFVQGLPLGSTAWTGGFPEPFFLMSTPGNEFWLYMVEKVLSNWNRTSVRDSSGPQGLHNVMKSWVHNKLGGVRNFSMSDASETQIIRPPNDVVVDESTWRWYIDKSTFSDEAIDNKNPHKLGFIPNQIVDPTACLAFINECRYAHCHDRTDLSGALFVHHCHESWA